jgi:hypothetical protein
MPGEAGQKRLIRPTVLKIFPRRAYERHCRRDPLRPFADETGLDLTGLNQGLPFPDEKLKLTNHNQTPTSAGESDGREVPVECVRRFNAFLIMRAIGRERSDTHADADGGEAELDAGKHSRRGEGVVLRAAFAAGGDGCFADDQERENARYSKERPSCDRSDAARDAPPLMAGPTGDVNGAHDVETQRDAASARERHRREISA